MMRRVLVAATALFAAGAIVVTATAASSAPPAKPTTTTAATTTTTTVPASWSGYEFVFQYYQVDIVAGQLPAYNVLCPVGKKVISGGFEAGDAATADLRVVSASRDFSSDRNFVVRVTPVGAEAHYLIRLTAVCAMAN